MIWLSSDQMCRATGEIVKTPYGKSNFGKTLFLTHFMPIQCGKTPVSDYLT